MGREIADGRPSGVVLVGDGEHGRAAAGRRGVVDVLGGAQIDVVIDQRIGQAGRRGAAAGGGAGYGVQAGIGLDFERDGFVVLDHRIVDQRDAHIETAAGRIGAVVIARRNRQ